MLTDIDHDDRTLVDKILFATSQEDVKHHIEVVVNRLQREGEDIHFFAERILESLDAFNPLDSSFQQWANISMARVYFHRFQYDLYTEASL